MKNDDHFHQIKNKHRNRHWKPKHIELHSLKWFYVHSLCWIQNLCLALVARVGYLLHEIVIWDEIMERTQHEIGNFWMSIFIIYLAGLSYLLFFWMTIP